MKNNAIKAACRRGFTLIELMIVIVILGVLMGTILPRLTGAQSSARDTGRKADLHSIAQALETYYDYNSEYPGIAGEVVCLDGVDDNPTTDTTNEDIGEFLKGGVPTPPSSEQVTVIGGETCTGSYAYAPLKSKGLANNGYIIATDVEVYQNANYSIASALDISDTTEAKDIVLVDGTGLKSVDTANATHTIFVITR